MKKLFLIILILFTITIFFNSNLVIYTVIDTSKTFFYKIFPSLFIFFIISNFLINYGFIELVSNKLGFIMTKLFKINKNTAFIFIMSMISGFPSNSKYTSDLYKKGIITENEASKILTFTHFSNPFFIIGSVSLFLNNKKAAVLILIIHYLTNIIVGLIFRNIISTPALNNKIIKIDSKDFSSILKESIHDSFDTLLLILGTMIFYLVIINLLFNYININNYFKAILTSILEISGGINSICATDISLRLKTVFIGIFLSFGGISVHTQIKSIISDTPIKYYPFFLARIIHASFTGLLLYFLYNFI